MTDTLIARFWKRGPGVTLTERAGGGFGCLTAEGTQMVNGIGSGKVVIPAYDDMRRTALQQIAMGDVCVAYSLAPDGVSPQHIACFLVETKQYRNGDYEISGPDFIAELEDYVAIAPIGEETTVESTASSMGAYLDQAPNPDVWVPLEAAYAARGYFTQDVTPAGDINVLFTEHMAVQVTDTFRYTFANGELFETKVVGVSDGRTRVEIEDGLPQQLPGSAKVDFLSTRLRVADGSLFIEGAQVFYTPNTLGKPTGNFIIDRIELGDGDAPDYLYSADPLLDGIDAGSTISQIQYTEPTLNPVGQLLLTSTFSEWRVWQGAGMTNGAAYAPNAETVYDVLLAIADITGYSFRRALFPLETSVNLVIGGVFPGGKPLRWLEYFKPAAPPAATFPDFSVQTFVLGTENRAAANYGELFSLESDNTNRLVTHVIPYGGGGGSGRFDFRTANIGTVLADYDDLDWGIVGGQYYVYNAALMGLGERAVWTVETFSQISPLNPASFQSRREAADMLLRAACDFLMANEAVDTTYAADIFTLGEPLPGDVVTLDWGGVEPADIEEPKLLITEVQHRFDPETGYRVTTLTMSKNGLLRQGGAMGVARGMLDMQRAIRHSNFGSRGDARITYDTVEFGGDGNVSSRSGDMIFRSITGNLEMTAAQGDVLIAGQDITLSGTVEVEGDISMRSLTLRDRSAPLDYEAEAFTLRGIPRVTLTRRARVTD